MNLPIVYITCISIDQTKPIGRRTGFAPTASYCDVPLDDVLFFARDT